MVTVWGTIDKGEVCIAFGALASVILLIRPERAKTWRMIRRIAWSWCWVKGCYLQRIMEMGDAGLEPAASSL